MMVQEKKRVPALRFEGFSGEWEEKMLGEITKVTMGQSPDSKNYTYNSDDYILVQGNADILNERIIPRVWTTQVTKKAEAGDLIMSVRAPVGDMGITDYNVVLGRGVAGIKANHFIFFYLCNLKIIGYWNGVSTGSTFDSINSDNLNQVAITLPSLDEQTQIGKFFKQLDKVVHLLEKELNKYKDLKKAYLAKMFPKEGEKVPELRFPGFSGEWEKNEFSKLGNTFSGLIGKKKEDFDHGDAQYVTYMNVYQNTLSSGEMLESIEIDTNQNKVKKGDVFFTTSSETPEEVGLSSVWTHDMDNVYLNSFSFGFRPTFGFNLNFLAYLLRANPTRHKIVLLAQGISRYNISKIKLLEIEIYYPCIQEQTKIGNFFKQLDETIEKQAQELEKYKDLKKAYLAKMFV